MSENRMLMQILGLNRCKVTGWRKLDAASCHRYYHEIMLFVAIEVGGVYDRR